MKSLDVNDRRRADAVRLERDLAAAPPFGGDANAPKNAEGPVASPVGPVAVPDSWAPPTPLDAVAVPPFPVDALPEPMRSYVTELAEAMQTPPDLPAMLVLSVVAAALAKRAVVEAREGWLEPVNIYTVTALPPATRKSSVFSEVIAPIVAHERREADRMAPLVAEAQSERKVLQARLSRAEKAAADVDDETERQRLSEEAAQIARELAGQAERIAPRLLAQDVTPETLATLLVEHGGRMAIFSAEGEIFQLVAGRYSSTGAPNVEVLLKAHAGDDLRVDRRGRAEFIQAPALTLGLTVQPDVIQSLARTREFRGRGLLGRFLYSLPRSTVGRRRIEPPPVSEATRAAYHDAIVALLRLAPTVDEEGRPREHRINLAQPARVALLAFGADLEPRLGEEGDLAHLGDFAGKLTGAVARIAGLLHAARLAPAAPWGTPIGEATMVAATNIGRYLLEHAMAAFALMGEDAALEDARRVLRAIQQRGEGRVTVRDVHQWARGSVPTVERIERAIGILAEHGFVQPLPAPPRTVGRRRSPAYAVSPYAQNPQNTRNPMGRPA